MICVKRIKDGTIRRVKFDIAYKLVESGQFVYTNKTEWKQQRNK
jgi:hypothetical protein